MKGKIKRRAAMAAASALQSCAGGAILHKNGSEYKFSAYIQPDVNRNRRYLQEDYTPAGRADTSRYLYRGAARGVGAMITEGDIISAASGRYRVVAIYDYYIGDEPIYRSGWLEAIGQGVE